jgi:hypothetical protein
MSGPFTERIDLSLQQCLNSNYRINIADMVTRDDGVFVK